MRRRHRAAIGEITDRPPNLPFSHSTPSASSCPTRPTNDPVQSPHEAAATLPDEGEHQSSVSSSDTHKTAVSITMTTGSEGCMANSSWTSLSGASSSDTHTTAASITTGSEGCMATASQTNLLSGALSSDTHTTAGSENSVVTASQTNFLPVSPTTCSIQITVDTPPA